MAPEAARRPRVGSPGILVGAVSVTPACLLCMENTPTLPSMSINPVKHPTQSELLEKAGCEKARSLEVRSRTEDLRDVRTRLCRFCDSD